MPVPQAWTESLRRNRSHHVAQRRSAPAILVRCSLRQLSQIRLRQHRTRERAGAVPGSGLATRVAVLAQLVATASPVIVSTAVVVSSATRFTRRGIAMLLRRLAVFNPAHLLRSSLWLVALKGTLLIVAVHRARISVLDRGTVFKARILLCGARRAERLEPLPLVSSLDGSMVLNGIAFMKLARPWRRGNFRMPVVKGGPLHAI